MVNVIRDNASVDFSAVITLYYTYVIDLYSCVHASDGLMYVVCSVVEFSNRSWTFVAVVRCIKSVHCLGAYKDRDTITP